jgi:hypothetical protein
MKLFGFRLGQSRERTTSFACHTYHLQTLAFRPSTARRSRDIQSRGGKGPAPTPLPSGNSGRILIDSNPGRLSTLRGAAHHAGSVCFAALRGRGRRSTPT